MSFHIKYSGPLHGRKTQGDPCPREAVQPTLFVQVPEKWLACDVVVDHIDKHCTQVTLFCTCPTHQHLPRVH